MHDGHVHGSCTDCESFVGAFERRGGLADWGYCTVQTPAAPPAQSLGEIESAFVSGNREPLRHNEVGLFRAEEDDACDLMRPRDWR